MLFEVLAVVSFAMNMTITGLALYYYFLLKKLFQKIKMNPEELLQDAPLNPDKENDQDTKKDRLSAIVAGGGGKQYLGKELQLSDIDEMSPEQINKLYCRYEARLGASMTKTLGNSFINLYVVGVGKCFHLYDPPKLIQELEEDPFVNHALTSVCCELYYKYGMYLAPFTAMLTTAKHIDFSKNIIIENKDESGAGEE